MISLTISLLGGGPEGGVTDGSLESGPVVGVFAVAVDDGLVDEELDVASASSALFSEPTSMLELDELEPQPAIRTPAASVARLRPARERMAWRSLKWLTSAQTNGTGLR